MHSILLSFNKGDFSSRLLLAGDFLVGQYFFTGCCPILLILPKRMASPQFGVFVIKRRSRLSSSYGQDGSSIFLSFCEHLDVLEKSVSTLCCLLSKQRDKPKRTRSNLTLFAFSRCGPANDRAFTSCDASSGYRPESPVRP